MGIRVLLWVVPCGVYYWTQYRAFGLYRLWLVPDSARRWFFVVLTALIVALGVGNDVANSLNLDLRAVLLKLPSAMLQSPPWSEALEELVFRGVILSELLNLTLSENGRAKSEGGLAVPDVERFRLSFWMANLSASLAFVGLHWPWWIFGEGIGSLLLLRSAGVLALSLVLGMLLVRSRSIWPCIFVHWLNNALVSLGS
jgi:membrane protease YdiL (CAAX protease family)